MNRQFLSKSYFEIAYITPDFKKLISRNCATFFCDQLKFEKKHVKIKKNSKIIPPEHDGHNKIQTLAEDFRVRKLAS